jgi:hypothetical protein
MEVGEPLRTWNVEPVEEPVPETENDEPLEPAEELEPVAA